MLVKYNSTKMIAALFATAAVAVLVVATLITGPVSAASTNDIIYGGVDSVAELKQKYRNGDGHHSAANIQRIYREALGVTSANQFDGMVSGYVYRNGDIKVNGRTVATDAKTSGRHNFRNSKPLGSTGAYYERASVRFSSGTERVAAFVQMQGGEFKFAVEKPCGNPSWAEPVPQPKYYCKSLTANKSNVKVDEAVDFTATPFTKNGASVKSYIFNFGDGSGNEVSSDNQASHTYTEAGTYQAKVQVVFEVNGSEKRKQIPASCKLTITVSEKPTPQEPEYQCDSLTIDNGDDDTVAPRRVNFVGSAEVTDTEVNGYTYVVLDADGDEVERERIDTDALSVEFSYLFDEPGEYDVYLLVHTTDGDTERVSNCEVQIVADEQPEEPTPEPEPEPELPKTGVFTATAGVAGTTGLWVGARKWLESRRKLLQNLMNK